MTLYFYNYDPSGEEDKMVYYCAVRTVFSSALPLINGKQIYNVILNDDDTFGIFLKESLDAGEIDQLTTLIDSYMPVESPAVDVNYIGVVIE